MSQWPSDARARTRLIALAVALTVSPLGAFMNVHPTGFVVTDRLWSVVAVAAVGIAATRARRWTWLVLAGLAGAFAASTLGLISAAIAVAIGATAVCYRRVLPVAGAAAGGLGAVAALDLRDIGAPGTGELLALAAVAPVLASAYSGAHGPTRAHVRKGLVGLGGFSLLAVAVFVGALVMARPSIEAAAADLSQAGLALRAGGFAEAESSLTRAAGSLASAYVRIGFPSAVVRTLPLVGSRAATIAETTTLARNASLQAAEVVQASARVSDAASPGQIDPASLDQLRPPVIGLAATLAPAAELSRQLSSAWFIPALDARMEAIADQLEQARSGTQTFADSLDGVADLLGANGDRRYLVLFVTPTEARANGFPGNYAELTISDGHLAMPRFGRVIDLRIDGPADLSALGTSFRERYQRFGIASEFRAATMSPHFPDDARLAAELYRQAPGGRAVDGVITIDPKALAGLLTITGPVHVDQSATPLTAATAEEFLLLGQYTSPNADRIDGLESLSRATFAKLVTSPLPGPAELVRLLGPLVSSGHLQVSAFRPVAAAFTSGAGLDHPLPAASGHDALAVVSSNAIGGKVDAFLHRSVDYDVTWNPETGEVSGRIRVTLVNAAPASGLPDYVIGNALVDGQSVPAGTNRSILSVFSPLDARSVTVNGKPAPYGSGTERGLHVYDVIVQLAPNGGTATIDIDLSGRIAAGHDYQLTIWNQVLVHPDTAAVTVRTGQRKHRTQVLVDQPRVVHFDSR